MFMEARDKTAAFVPLSKIISMARVPDKVEASLIDRRSKKPLVVGGQVDKAINIGRKQGRFRGIGRVETAK